MPTNRELYDRICQELTWYEHPQEHPLNNVTDSEIADEFYNTLVAVQNWMVENGLNC